MSIEFECSQCSKTLRVADSTAGKKCKCPSCGVTLSIPSIPPEEALDVKIEIACPQCSNVLLFAPELEGTRGLCKGCGHIFTLTYDPSRQEQPSGTFPFQCPNCEFLFEGKPEMEGRKGKCTECQSVFTIKKMATNKQTVAPITQPTIPAKPTASSKPVAKPKPKPTKPATAPMAIPAAVPIANPYTGATASVPQSGGASPWDAIDLTPTARPATASSSQSFPAYNANPYSAGMYAPSMPAQRNSYSSSSMDIMGIAKWHRKLCHSIVGLLMIIPIYVMMVIGTFMMGAPNKGEAGPLGIVFALGMVALALVMFAIGLFFLISYIVLCTKVYETGMAVLMILGYFIGGIVPFLPFVILVVVIVRGNSILKSHGYQVGLLGVSPDQLR
ncbi:hypothetical protein SH449x_001507 [Pirellulaceae bacterium SH449]